MFSSNKISTELNSYSSKDNDLLNQKYIQQIKDIGNDKLSYLSMKYDDLKSLSEGDVEEKTLKRFNHVLKNDFEVETDIAVVNMPKNIDLVQIGSKDIGKIVSTRALISNISKIYPGIFLASMECNSCNKRINKPQSDIMLNPKPFKCIFDSCSGIMNLRPDESQYKDYQILELEEPLENRKNSQPQTIKAIISGGIINPERKFAPRRSCKRYRYC